MSSFVATSAQKTVRDTEESFTVSRSVSGSGSGRGTGVDEGWGVEGPERLLKREEKKPEGLDTTLEMAAGMIRFFSEPRE